MEIKKTLLVHFNYKEVDDPMYGAEGTGCMGCTGCE